MADKDIKVPSTSIEKSHSKWSNTKLTFLCILSAICFAVFFVGLGMIGLKSVQTIIGVLFTIIGALAAALCILLLNKFKR